MVVVPVESLFLVLTGLVGIFHVWSPDHWLPLSVISWQKRWSAPRTVLTWTAACLAHVGLGLALAALVAPLLRWWDAPTLFLLSIALVLVFALLRGRRLVRLQEVLRSGALGRWGLYVSVGLLGPAELMVPIAVKGYQLGFETLASGVLIRAAVVFGLCTWMGGLAAVLYGRARWEVPQALPRALQSVARQVGGVPLFMSVCLAAAVFVQNNAG